MVFANRSFDPPTPGVRLHVFEPSFSTESPHVTPLLAFLGIGTMELMVVAGVILLLFGSRLPKVMRSLGEGIVEFKRGVQGIEDDPHASHSGSSDRQHDSGRVESHR